MMVSSSHSARLLHSLHSTIIKACVHKVRDQRKRHNHRNHKQEQLVPDVCSGNAIFINYFGLNEGEKYKQNVENYQSEHYLVPTNLRIPLVQVRMVLNFVNVTEFGKTDVIPENEENHRGKVERSCTASTEHTIVIGVFVDELFAALNVVHVLLVYFDIHATFSKRV